MTQASSRADGSVGAKGPDELRRQIEATRAQLGDTVEELAAKADVKARVHSAKADAQARAHSAWERVPRQAVVVGGAGVAVAMVGVWSHWRWSAFKGVLVSWRERGASVSCRATRRWGRFSAGN